jgi:hypothetical protein
MTSRWRRGTFVALLVALIVAVGLGIRPVREPILRAAGAALVVADPLSPADVIVISVHAGGAGVLEAADLVAAGTATRVAVFADPPRAEDLEFIRRGLPYEDQAARQVRQLAWLGVNDVVRIPRSDAGTQGEGDVLPHWSDETGVRSIVLVVAADHARRIRRVLIRSMNGRATKVMIRPSRYSEFDPQRWWQTRHNVRTLIIEYQKLALDIVLHPFSG